jgi:predicted nucleic acid-binding protein
MIGSDRNFVDTNIFVYAHLDNELEKYGKAKFLFENILMGKKVIISVQVVNEFYSAMSRYKYSHGEIVKFVSEISVRANIRNISFDTSKKAFYIRDKYQYSWWDSLVLASALENDCKIIYSEDMQDGQIIENTLKIVNPFAG